jgi:hypothetical protein
MRKTTRGKKRLQSYHYTSALNLFYLLADLSKTPAKPGERRRAVAAVAALAAAVGTPFNQDVTAKSERKRLRLFGLSAEQAYKAALYAHREATGEEDHPLAAKVRQVADEYRRRVDKAWRERDEQDEAAPPKPRPAPVIPTNPWPELRGEWEKFIAEEGGRP